VAKQDGSAGFWGVRDVSEATRKKVKLYAVEHDITIGKAVEELVEKALSQNQTYPDWLAPFMPTDEALAAKVNQYALQQPVQIQRWVQGLMARAGVGQVEWSSAVAREAGRKGPRGEQ